MNGTGDIVLALKGVSKRYPGTLAVDCVDFEARAGEVHALMGENGAGKSTLMNIIAGAFADYAGEIFVRGRRVGLHSPALARAAGIGMIHQELSLAPPLSVAENILAGRLPARRPDLACLEMQTTGLEAERTREVVAGWLTQYGKELGGIVNCDDAGAMVGINQALRDAWREDVIRIAAGNSKVGMDFVKEGG